MNSYDLSIIVVSYNTADLTLNALRSAVTDILQAPDLKEKSEIIIVDNASTDDSVTQLQAFTKTVPLPISIIKNQKNVGFSKANNQAIREARGKYILLLNSDTYVQPSALEKLVLTMKESTDQSSADLSSYHRTIDRLGILAATLINPDGSYQAQGGSYPTLLSLITHMIFIDDLPLVGKFFPSTQERECYEVVTESTSPELIQKDWVAGTAMLLRKEMLEEIGLLDEAIFMYAEDMELCVRAINHHWDVAIHPTAVITHIKTASSSSEKAIAGEFKGYLHIWSKHKPIWQLHAARAILKLGILLRVLVFGTMRRKELAQTYRKVWKLI